MRPNSIVAITSPMGPRLSGFVKFGVTPGGGKSAGVYLYRLESIIVDVIFGSNIGQEYDQKDVDRGEKISGIRCLEVDWGKKYQRNETTTE